MFEEPTMHREAMVVEKTIGMVLLMMETRNDGPFPGWRKNGEKMTYFLSSSIHSEWNNF